MKYTDYFEVKRKIELLKRLSARNAAPDEFATLLQGLLLDKFEIRGHQLGDEPLYRARRNEPGRLFVDVGELKHPQSSPSKGRMNEVGESFFYGAICELGTIYEMVPAIGSLFTISTIAKRGGSPIFLIAGLLNDHRSPTPKNATEKAIYDYLHGELTRVTNVTDDYNATIAISRLFLSKGLVAPEGFFIAGLVYPSVQMARGVANVRTFNVGMPGRSFDDNFYITGATVYCLTDEASRYQLNEVNRGSVAENGSIKWQFSFTEMQQRMQAGLAADGMLVEKLKTYANRP